MTRIHLWPGITLRTTEMLAQIQRVGVHALIIVAPVEVADVAAGHGFEEEGTPEGGGGVDGVVPGFAHALGE